MSFKLTPIHQTFNDPYKQPPSYLSNTDSKIGAYTIAFFGTLLTLFVGWKIQNTFYKRPNDVSTLEEKKLRKELDLRPLRRHPLILEKIKTLKEGERPTASPQPSSGTQSDNEPRLPEIFSVKKSFSDVDLTGLQEMSLSPPNRSTTQTPHS